MGVSFTNVLIADGRSDMRYRLQLALAQMPGVVTIGEACDGETAVQKVCELTPHILILDIAIPGLAGLEVIRRVKSRFPSIKILVHTSMQPAAFALAALKAGASGYCLYGASQQTLESAVKTLNAGAVWLDANIAAKMLMLLPAQDDRAKLSALENNRGQ